MDEKVAGVLPLQLFFERAFINKASIRKRSGDIESIYISKIASLYCQFDSLLNTLSRTYSGLTQDINTDELLINYHNISTVFNITAAAGISQSQKTGDRRLKLKANEESCYYKTYVKAYPLLYQKALDTAMSRHKVSLKECHIILMMDNLVHLSMKTDPKPGENRSNQICTLPITIKGIPKDSSQIQNWHGESCDQSSDCICLKSTTLMYNDIQNILFDHLPEENKVFTQFKKEATWGSSVIWQDVSSFTNLDLAHIGALNSSMDALHLEEITDKGQIEDLDKTMESLQLDEAAAEIERDDDSTTTEDYTFETTGETMNNTASSSHCSHLEIPQLLGLDITAIHEADNSSTLHLNDPDSEDEDELERMLNEVNIEMDTVNTTDVQGTTHFQQYKPPNLLCRHPPPKSGRDDDIHVLKGILDDIVSKIEPDNSDRILFAPDYKIAKNLLKLMDQSKKYHKMLPEFPVLLLRKSKITNLISAYKTSGLIHILQFMKDEEKEKDWSKLLSIDNIETATRNIWRLSTALHTSCVVVFMDTIEKNESDNLLNDLLTQGLDVIDKKWKAQFEAFVNSGCKNNATFCLHFEIMTHCDEIVAIALAERIGGPDGYNILLASVKSSLPFSFLNGASSYGIFCTRLLHEHYRSSPFHKKMKETLFSTPHNESSVNFGLDTCREIDHRIAKKSIRQGSSLENILAKMCTVDEQQEVHTLRKYLGTLKEIPEDESQNEDTASAMASSDRFLGKKITRTDKLHIYRTIKLILRSQGITTQNEDLPRNIYHTLQPELPLSILDRETYDVGKYLILKYVADTELFGDCSQPDIGTLKGPKTLISRVKKGQSVTINRSRIKVTSTKKTQLQREEDVRKRKVVQLSKIVDCMSSKMNLCQAVVKPDCSKTSTNKSLGVRKALSTLLQRCLISGARVASAENENTSHLPTLTTQDDLMMINFTSIPEIISSKTSAAIIEFAGVKFKNFATSGNQYLQYLQNGVLKPIFQQLPFLKHIVICEEKYSFTPDDFKYLTRKKRQKEEKVTISHLKEKKEVVSEDKISKSAVIGTSEGKKLISNYLGEHVRNIDIKRDIILDIDSETNMHGCTCKTPSCKCRKFTTPVRAVFTKKNGLENTQNLNAIMQRKGEAEMSQMDWMKEIFEELKDGDYVVNVVSSADIDTVIIHLFAISLHWPRNNDNSFKHNVFLWLSKKKPDLYNITDMILVFEKFFKMKYVGAVIAVCLCIGGNDFLPNYHGISHEAILTTLTNDHQMLSNLIQMSFNPCGTISKCSISEDIYVDLLKRMYCPSNLNNELITMEEVRQMTIKMPNKPDFRHPQSWMPPVTSLKKLCCLTQCQIDYLMTAYNHSADLPDFLSSGCLLKSVEGDVTYDLGKIIHIQDKNDLLTIPETELTKTINEAKIVKRRTKKRELDVTPRKSITNKRQPRISTPRKMKNLPKGKKSDM